MGQLCLLWSVAVFGVVEIVNGMISSDSTRIGHQSDEERTGPAQIRSIGPDGRVLLEHNDSVPQADLDVRSGRRDRHLYRI